MLIPQARGALSSALFEAMRTGADDLPAGLTAESDDDAQIALWALYELHYRGFKEVSDDLEWHPGLLGLRRDLERDFEARLRERRDVEVPDGAFDAEAFFEMVAADDGPSTAAYVHRHAGREQVLELLRQRSIYHLKESDPTAWVVPRLPVETKAALMELQYDEYGCGDP
ncbi:MAG: iron-containing redox enzyme family protein, partial [Nocardioides sp.]|nr:iron-containing redox enzyme family protein [Nocardioides sp.]